MASNARDSDPTTSHATNPTIESDLKADRAKVRFFHYGYIRRGLTDWELDDLCGGHMNGRWRKRRCDLTIGSKAPGEKILIMAQDCPGWTGEHERRNPRTNKWQKVWVVRPHQEAPATTGTVTEQVASYFFGGADAGEDN